MSIFKVSNSVCTAIEPCMPDIWCIVLVLLFFASSGLHALTNVILLLLTGIKMDCSMEADSVHPVVYYVVLFSFLRENHVVFFQV